MIKLREILRRLKLSAQFTVLLSLIFVAGIGLGGFALSKALEHRAETEMSDRAQLVMQIMSSISSDTNDQMALRTDARLTLANTPSVVSKRIFERLQQDWKYRDYQYRTAALNPTNLADKTDLFEAKLIEQFQNDRTLKMLSGFRNDKHSLFYSAQPLIITEQSCLQCHSTPEQAPKSHVDRYGSRNGYGWQLNQIVGTRIVYLPANEVFSNVRQALFMIVSIFTVMVGLVLLLVNDFLKRRVIRPLKPMSQLATMLCLEKVDALEVENLAHQGLHQTAQRKDELGQLGKVFQRMVREILDRERKLAEQLRQLKVEVDHNQRRQEVSEIESSEYFQKLQQDAKQIRDRQWTEQ
jgi:HAMP domain-containing protein